MLADDFTQAPPDTIAQDRAADLAGRHKSGAKTVICVADEHAQHQQFAALSAAILPDEFKLRTSRQPPVSWKRKISPQHDDCRCTAKIFPRNTFGKRLCKMNRLRIYGEGDVLTLTLTFVSVFSVLVAGDGFTIVVLVSFFSVFSAGGLFTVVSFCSQAASKATPVSRQMYFFIQVDRTREPIPSFLWSR